MFGARTVHQAKEKLFVILTLYSENSEGTSGALSIT